MSAPPNGGKIGVVERLAAILQSLTLQNILVAAILVAIAIPSYFFWRFMQDESFRHEFMSTAKVVDYDIPCLVVNGNVQGMGDRTIVAVQYENVNLMERLIAVRAPGLMSNGEVKTACEIVHTDVALMRALLADQRTQEKK